MPMEIEDFSETELLIVDKSGKYCPNCQLSRIVTRAHQMGYDEGVNRERAAGQQPHFDMSIMGG